MYQDKNGDQPRRESPRNITTEMMICKDSNKDLNPDFIEKIINLPEDLAATDEPVHHEAILIRLIEQIEPVNFQAQAYPEAAKLFKELSKLDPNSPGAIMIKAQIDHDYRVSRVQILVLSIENLLAIAQRNAWDICKNHDFIYLYNGAFWNNIDPEAFKKFLGEAAEKMGIDRFSARYYTFRDQLYRQFLSAAYLPSPAPQRDVVLINLRNGTFEVTPDKTILRPFNASDFITYQLPFNYDPSAEAPLFHKYLDRVLPEKERQMVLAEFMGYVFMKHGGRTLKEEKALVLFGPGANGKSVFHEIVTALLGSKNISSYSLQALTNESGYFRAMIANTLVNYASEISGNLNTAIFKQLCSGEPVEARLPYGQPFTLSQYAKLIFNCNQLPHDVEHTRAYFRRFLIIPFDVIIPEPEQDKQLHTKIIDNELSGVFNWILEGLHRLLKNRRFTYCEAIQLAAEDYERSSDSVRMFLEENNYSREGNGYVLIKNLYTEYRGFCYEDGCKPVNKQNFIKRLKGINVIVERKNIGNVASLVKNDY